MLRDSASVLDATYEVGLSGPGRLHDLFVTHEAMSPGEWKSGGEGLTVIFGFHPSPFGKALVMATERGLAGLALADAGEEPAALDDMKRRWPKANYVEDTARTGADPAAHLRSFAMAARAAAAGGADRHRLGGAGLGSAAENPDGHVLATYSGIAGKVCTPAAARAVGAAVGKNPIAFVVPCHRVIGKQGALTGYHWGITRKRAMLGWEAGSSARQS